jgi:putative hemolysin
MINVETAVRHLAPSLLTQPPLVRRPVLAALRFVSKERHVNKFLDQHADAEGFLFVEKVLENLGFRYTVDQRDRQNIPACGRVVIVANHPIGTLDGLALLHLVGEIRRDVKIMANELLANVKPLQPLVIPVNTQGGLCRKSHFMAALAGLNRDEALIVFPAGEVSRIRPTGVRDPRWRDGFLRLAERTGAPILPVHIEARNSALFYAASTLLKPLGALLLAREMLKHRSDEIRFRIGEPIPANTVARLDASQQKKLRLVRRHLYRLGSNRTPMLRTERQIAHPESRARLRQELSRNEFLGQTPDGRQIYLVDARPDSSVLRELGRLRELAFRRVGEGVGAHRDLDPYDAYYRHLVLWDDRDLEVVGAYRLGEVAGIRASRGTGSLYTESLFTYKDEVQPQLARGVELGRSFVQPRYWGLRSLDILWLGIGAYLRTRPELRYLFGPVSISNAYPTLAKDLLVYFYNLHFGAKEVLALARNPYAIGAARLKSLRELFPGEDYGADLRTLRDQLTSLNLSVPTLYRQYTELCVDDGVRFLDFGVDPAFSHCVDGLVIVDLERLHERKRRRYLESNPLAERVELASAA